MELAGLGPSSEFLRLARSQTSLIADLDPFRNHDGVHVNVAAGQAAVY